MIVKNSLARWLFAGLFCLGGGAQAQIESVDPSKKA